MRGVSRAWKVRVLAIGLLLTLTPFVQVFGQGSGATASSTTVPYSDYGLSVLSSADRITMDSLKTSTGDNLTIAGFEGYIKQNLTAFDIRMVLLDIGWENYTVGTIPDEIWVIDWLTACDVMGVQNVIYLAQLTTQGIGSPWKRSLLTVDPAAQTYFANGTAAEYVSYDNPDVSNFLEKDLAIVYSYYGSYPSWIGIGTGSSAVDPYYMTAQSIPDMGYSNQSIANFVDSSYYAPDVNATGYLPNGQEDPLWASFKDVQPSIQLSSGVWTTSSPVNVYGNGSLSGFVEMRFQLQANTSSIGFSWYGSKVGDPGTLDIQLYGDQNGSLDTARLIATYAVGASSFTNVTGWQSGQSAPMNLTAGNYWAKFSSPTSDNSSYYQVYFNNQGIDNIAAYAQEGYVGPGFQHGSSVLWLKNATGANLALYPYRQAVVGNPTTQTFTANSAFSFNTVFLFLSDRIYDTTNGTITVTDSSDNGEVVATGILSQQSAQGLEGWVPISLDTTATAIPGHTYVIQISEPNSGYSWLVALRGLSTDPPSAGFQGQASYWLFQLGELNWVQGHLGFIDMTTTGVDAVTSGYLDAVRFMPSSNETLNSVSVLMASSSQAGNYTSGAFSVSIWTSSASGLTPSSPLPGKLTVPAEDVPGNGWLNATGLNQSVAGGRYYWAVFSANSTQSFTMARFTNAYAFDVQVSLNGGSNWQEPREGPTEFGFVVSLSNQKLGNFISSESGVQIDSTGYFAEPFYADETAQVSGVYLGRLSAGGLLSVSINPDTESNQPSLSPIASGIFNADNVTLGGPQFVQFSSVANLNAGQEYWLVVHPLTGNYPLYPIVYLPDAPYVVPGLPSIVSQDDGLTWTKVSNTTSTLVYQLASPPVHLPEYNTSELARYLSSYHSPSVSDGLVYGWTGYIAASELSLFGQITHWLNADTGRNFDFYGRGETNVLNQLVAKSDVLIPAVVSRGSCSGLESELTAQMPVSGVQYYDVSNSSLITECAESTLGPVLQQLGHVLGTGQTYGQTSQARVLVVGDAISVNLTRYLSIAYNTTYAQLSLDPSLNHQGNLSKYTAIVWTSSENPSPGLESHLARYVKAGGTLILTQFGGDESNLSSLSASLPNGNTTESPPGPAYLTALASHTSYNGLSVNSSSTETQGESADVSIIIRNYDAGRFYLVWFSASEVTQVSDPVVLLSNIVASASGLPDPFWYGLDSSSPNPSMQFNVLKTGSGHILVWVTNTGNQNATFSLDLNGTYYGVPSTWKVLNLNDLAVSTGSGSELAVGGNLTAGSWLPIFIVPYSSAALIDYSSAQINGQFVYPGQSFYKLSAVSGQEVLLLLSSNVIAGQVVVDDNQSLPELQSIAAFSHASGGWVYNNLTKSILVKFVSSGPSTLRFEALTAPAEAPAVLPMRSIFIILVVLVCTELAVLSVAAILYWKRRTPNQVPLGP
ncbi:MAG: hypothetical protein OK456_07490 [Thaumarchaeota archaeon]|nr:hypothetical protein [Nitrososphaerota archaeon]